MAHPFNHHRNHKVQKRRVSHIAHGYATGGAVAAAGISGTSAPKPKKAALRMSGGKVKARLDRRARGGKVKDHDPHGAGDDETINREAGKEQAMKRARGGRAKKGHTTVNVMVAPQHGVGGPAGPMPPMPAGGPPMPPPGAGAMPPHPPMGPPGMPPGAPPGMPPSGPPMLHNRGGRVNRAMGGSVKSGPAWNTGVNAGTQVQHSPGKNDTANIGRGKPITYKTGGKVESPDGVAPATELPGGSGGGKARLAKEHRVERR